MVKVKVVGGEERIEGVKLRLEFGFVACKSPDIGCRVMVPEDFHQATLAP